MRTELLNGVIGPQANSANDQADINHVTTSEATKLVISEGLECGPYSSYSSRSSPSPKEGSRYLVTPGTRLFVKEMMRQADHAGFSSHLWVAPRTATEGGP